MQNAKDLEAIENTAKNSAGSAMKEQESYMNSISTKLNALKENVKGIFIDVGNTEFFKDVIDGVDTIAVGVRGLIHTFGGLPTTIGLAVGAMTIFNEKTRKFMTDNNVVGIGSLKKIYEGLNERLNRYARNQQSVITTLKSNKENQNALNQSITTYTTKMGLAQAKLIAFKGAAVAAKVATMALQSALSFGVGLITSFAIEKLVEGFSSLQKKIHMTKEQLDEFNSTSISNITKNVEDIKQAEQAMDNMKNIKSQMKNSHDESEQVQLKGELLECERKLAEIFPQTTTGFDKEGKAITDNTDAVKKYIKIKRDAIKSDFGDFASKNKNLAEDLQKTTQLKKEINDLQNTISKSGVEPSKGGMLEYLFGRRTSSDFNLNVLEDKKKQLKELTDEAVKAQEYIGKLRGLGFSDDEINKEFGKDITGALDDYTNSLADTEAESKNAKNGIDEFGNSVEKSKQETEEANKSLKLYADSFGKLGSEIDVAKKALKEFKENGKLSAGTVQSIFSTKDTELIAALGNRDTLEKNLEGIIENRERQQKQAFDEEVRQAINMEQNKTNAAAKGAKDRGNISDNETNNKSQSYSTDVNNYNSAQNTKNSNSAQESNNRVLNESNAVQAKIGIYGTDVINQGNAEINKTSNTAQSTGERSALENMLLSIQGGLYGVDVGNHGNAQGVKVSNTSQSTEQRFGMENNLLTNSSGLYGTDVANHSDAQGTKVSNTDSALNAILQNHVGLISNLGQSYSTDVTNWSSSLTAKLSATADFVNQSSSMLSKLSDQQLNVATQNVYAEHLKNPHDRASQDAFARDIQEQWRRAAEKNRQGINVGWNPVSTGGYTPQSYNPVGYSGGSGKGSSYKPKKYKNSGGGSSYKPKKSSSGKSGSGKGGSKSAAEKIDIKDIETKVDRYKQLEDALNDVNNALAMNKILQEEARGTDKIKYMKEEINLLNQKKRALDNEEEEKKREARELENKLRKRGFSIGNGNINNYKKRLEQIRNTVNAMANSNKKKEDAKKDYEELEKAANRYFDVTSNELPKLKQEWAEANAEIRKVKESQLSLMAEAEKETTEIIKKQIEKRKKAIEDETEKRKEEVQKQKDLYDNKNSEEDFQEELSNKQKKLDEINSKIESVRRDSSAEGQAKLNDYLKEQEEAQKDLNKFIKDKQRDDADKAFDKQLDLIDKRKDDKEKELDKKYTDEKITELAKGMIQKGFVEIEGHVIKLREAINGYYRDQGELFADSSMKMQDLIDKLEITKKLYSDIYNINKEIGVKDINILKNTGRTIVNMPKIANPISMVAIPSSKDMNIKSDLHIGTLNEGNPDDVKKMLEDNNKIIMQKIREESGIY